jgi:chemotaxis response regulator CheB
MEKVLAEQAIDVVVLDLRLAGEDGMQLAKQLRETSEIPIIIVSDRKDEADRGMALELGADDYLTKPFGPCELLARVRAVLRRYQTAKEVLPARNEKRRAYRFAEWELNLRTRRLTGAGGKRVELTNGEFSLLEAFCAAPQRVLSCEQLLARSTCRSCGCGARSRRIPPSPNTSRPNAAPATSSTRRSQSCTKGCRGSSCGPALLGEHVQDCVSLTFGMRSRESETARRRSDVMTKNNDSHRSSVFDGDPGIARGQQRGA